MARASAAGIVTQADGYASWLTDWVLLAGGLSALFCGLGVHNAATRTIYAMGRDGVLPAALGRTHPRHRTPHVAVIVNLVVMVLVAAAVIGFTGQATRDTLGATPGPLSAGFYLFAEGLTLITPLFMACYAVLSLAGMRFGLIRSTGGGRRPGLVAASAGSLVASVAALVGSLYYSFVAASPGAEIPGPYRAVPVFCLAVVVGGAGLGLVLRARGVRPGRPWARCSNNAARRPGAIR